MPLWVVHDGRSHNWYGLWRKERPLDMGADLCFAMMVGVWLASICSLRDQVCEIVYRVLDACDDANYAS